MSLPHGRTLDDVLSWPYPRPEVFAGPGQRRRARRLIARQFAITRDMETPCLVVSKVGIVVDRVYPKPTR